MPTTNDRYCIIGAGSSGLTAAKNLKDYAIPFDILEMNDDLGGNWKISHPNSRVYANTFLISSKPMTAYVDYPMPKEYPHFPHHTQIFRYLQGYARYFGIHDLIQFHTRVERVEKAAAGWDVTLQQGDTTETRCYRGIIIANGHNWDPKYPQIEGDFSGETLHSAFYKTNDIFKDKRVLVIGAGNSGCDIAVDAVTTARHVYQSMRRSYHYVPKMALGRPVDQWGELLHRIGTPHTIRRAILGFILWLRYGGYRRYGLARPDHKIFETHPIINERILPHYRDGKITPKPDVQRFAGDTVHFVDGSHAPIDLILYATGYHLSFPFIDRQYLNWQDGRPRLYMNTFHPTDDTLYIIGLIQPDSGQFGLVDRQAKVMARFIHAQTHHPDRANHFRQRKQNPDVNLSPGIRYKESERHYVKVEYYSYRNRLDRLWRELG